MNLKNTLLFFLLLLPLQFNNAQSLGDIKILRFDQLDPLLHQNTDTIYVVNFWATWCIPCRKELPAIEKIHKDFSDKPVEVLLVSLDSPNQIEGSLIPFLANNNITARVVLLNDPNSNLWINKVDSSWSGSIPATLVYNKNNREFFEKELDYYTLRTIILKQKKF
jgi:thiol-disulfide isomerase/thioredoxin